MVLTMVIFGTLAIAVQVVTLFTIAGVGNAITELQVNENGSLQLAGKPGIPDRRRGGGTRNANKQAEIESLLTNALKTIAANQQEVEDEYSRNTTQG